MLRCVILAACVGAFAALVMLGVSFSVIVAGLVFLAAVWFIGIELDVLPLLIEHMLVKRAAAGNDNVDSIWFVDLDAEDRRRMQGLLDDTEDNPTIR